MTARSAAVIIVIADAPSVIARSISDVAISLLSHTIRKGLVKVIDKPVIGLLYFRK